MSAHAHYGAYLNLDRLLDAQLPPGPDGLPRSLHHHDEMLFIVIHQVYELWFRQILHEIALVRDTLAKSPVPEPEVARVVKLLGRVTEIQRVLVAQISVLETMSPVDFLAFRDALGNASGFQSAQFRELEILAGLSDDKRYGGGAFELVFRDEVRARLDARRKEPSLVDVVYGWLERTPAEDGFADSYRACFAEYLESQRALHRANATLTADERAQAMARLDAYHTNFEEFVSGERAPIHLACLFIMAYQTHPLLHWPNRLLDALLEFEEWLRVWRFRHARMVERMIGLRVGTGGSAGVDYLDATAGGRYRLFTAILQSRSFLVPPVRLPPLRNPARYGYATS